MARIVRIALAQFKAVLGDVDANIANAERLIREAAQARADIVLLPELCFTGYQLELLGKQLFTLSDINAERIENAMCKAAKEGGLYVVAGLCVKDKAGYYNAARLYNRKGEREGEYRKNFAFAAERRYFCTGDELPVFDTDFGRVGILICYDIGFPETARALCMKGAEIVLIPSAWRIEDELSWNLNVPSRALENHFYTAAVNHVGTFGGLHLFGRSTLCDPRGRYLLQLGYDNQGLGVCDVDLDRMTTPRTPPDYRSDYMASHLYREAKVEDK